MRLLVSLLSDVLIFEIICLYLFLLTPNCSRNLIKDIDLIYGASNRLNSLICALPKIPDSSDAPFLRGAVTEEMQTVGNYIVIKIS